MLPGYNTKSMVKVKPRMGRPPKGNEAMMEPITVRLPKPMSVAIAAIQATRIDAPDKATVIRELIAGGLMKMVSKEKPRRGD